MERVRIAVVRAVSPTMDTNQPDSKYLMVWEFRYSATIRSFRILSIKNGQILLIQSFFASSP